MLIRDRRHHEAGVGAVEADDRANTEPQAGLAATRHGRVRWRLQQPHKVLGSKRDARDRPLYRRDLREMRQVGLQVELVDRQVVAVDAESLAVQADRNACWWC